MSLRNLGSLRGLKIGTAVRNSAFVLGGQYTTVLAQEFNLMEPESPVANFGTVEPTQGTFDYSGGMEAMTTFAQANSMELFGDILWAQGGNPAWVTGWAGTKAAMQAALQNHINTVLGHFGSKITTWKCVNEPLLSTGALENTNKWYTVIGPEYIDNCFQYARAASPTAKLFINEYGTEFAGPKQDGLYTLVTGMLQRGIPIDGVGFEMHFGLDAPSTNDMQAAFERFAALGLDVRVTEADYRIPDGSGAVALTKQAANYADLIDACLLVPRCTGLTFWGFTDSVSWIPGNFPGFGRAHLLDNSYVPKAGYTSVAARLGTFVGPHASPTSVVLGYENEDTTTFQAEFGGKSVQATNTVTLQGGVVHSGAVAAQHTFDGTGIFAYVTKWVYTNAPDDVTLIAWIRLNAAFAMALDSKPVQVLTMWTTGTAQRAALRVLSGTAAGTGRNTFNWQYITNDGTTSTFIYGGGAFGEVVKDTFQKVEIRFVGKSAAQGGGGSFKLNDVLMGSNFNLPYSGIALVFARIGADNGGQPPVAGSILYSDDITMIDPNPTLFGQVDGHPLLMPSAPSSIPQLAAFGVATDSAVILSAANAASIGTIDPLARRAYITGLSLSYSAAPTVAHTVDLVAGSLVVDRFQVPAAPFIRDAVEFARPVACPAGTPVICTVGAAGAAITSELVVRYFIA